MMLIAVDAIFLSRSREAEVGQSPVESQSAIARGWQFRFSLNTGPISIGRFVDREF